MIDSFKNRIRREFIRGSAIARHLYRASVEIVEDTGFWEPNRALNHHISRFHQTRKPHNFGAIALFKNEDGSYWQGKPEIPRIDPKKGTPNKYESIQGNSSRAYLPPVPAKIRKAIGQRNSVEVPLTGDFRDWLKQHPEISIILTEGGKKALSLLSQGYVAIALYGVNGGYRANEKIAGETIPLEKPELIDDLKPFAQPGRRFTLAFDQDSKPETRRKVAAALGKFGGLLVQAGCHVTIAEWSPEQGKGIDDLRVNCGAAAVDTALQEAISYQEWAIARRLARRVRRKPDLNIGDREFSGRDIPRKGLVALWGAKGGRKSRAIGEALGEDWLSITSLQSLARDQAAAWGGAFINDGDLFQGQFLKEGVPVAGGAVCIPSLLKVRSAPCKTLVIDEPTAVLRFLFLSKLANKNGGRSLLIDEVLRRIREAELVQLGDADLTEETLQWFEAVRGERAFLIRSERTPLPWTGHFIENRNQAIAEFVERVSNLPDGKLAYFNSDSRRLVEALAAYLKSQGIECLTITQHTSGGDVEREFLASKGAALPGLVTSGIKAILTSPSVTQGFSIERETDSIDSVWGISLGGSITAPAIAQSLDRPRDAIDRFIHVARQGSAYSRISKATNSREFARDFKAVCTATAQISRPAIKPELFYSVDSLDWDSPNISLISAFESERNAGMAALEATVKALLRYEGKTVKPFTPTLPEGYVQDVCGYLRLLKQEAKEQQQVAIATGPIPTEQEAKQLEQKAARGHLEPSELQALERYYIAQFYRLEAISLADVQFDDDGDTRRAIRNLEAILSKEAAIDRSAATINQNPTTPQDWNRAALQRSLLERSGALELILDIWAGKVELLSLERIEPIAKILQTFSRQFQLAFGFSNIDKVTPMQAIATLLDWCGIKRVSRRRRTEGGVVREYSIDQEHLAKLQAIVERRKASDPPPHKEDINQGGGSLPNLTKLPPEIAQTFAEMWAIAESWEERRELLRDIEAFELGEEAA